MSLDADRLGTTLDIPLDPSQAIRPTPTGDIGLLVGRDAVLTDLLRRLVTAPGEMVYRPQFGCGAVAQLGSANSPRERARSAAGARSNLLRDARLKDVVVGVTAADDGDATAIVNLTITLRDDSQSNVSVPV